jgi:hypothetical protein
MAVADPAMWAKHQGKSVAEQMRPLMLMPAKNDRIQGWMQLHTRLKDKKIKFWRTCPHIIRTLPMLTYDKNKPEDVDTTQEDHPGDGIRYMCMARTHRPMMEHKKKKSEAWAEPEGEEISWMRL